MRRSPHGAVVTQEYMLIRNRRRLHFLKQSAASSVRVTCRTLALRIATVLEPFAVGTIRATISSKVSKGHGRLTLSAMAACSALRLASLSLRPRYGGVAAMHRGGAARPSCCTPRRDALPRTRMFLIERARWFSFWDVDT